MAALGLGLIVFGLLVMAAVACGSRSRQLQRQAQRKRGSPGVGRAALRGYRVAGDVRAIARGPGAYGRRVVRRSAFRALRRL